MFSFSKLALFFTLGAAALTSAAPLLNDVDISDNTVNIRCENGCSSDGHGVDAQVSLTVHIQTLLDTVTPICADISMCYTLLLIHSC